MLFQDTVRHLGSSDADQNLAGVTLMLSSDLQANSILHCISTHFTARGSQNVQNSWTRLSTSDMCNEPPICLAAYDCWTTPLQRNASTHEYLTVCRVTPHDAARYWNRFEAEAYDCILLDAPCTSERHVVLASCGGRGSKSRWSLHQCKEMAALQVKLLTAALKVS